MGIWMLFNRLARVFSLLLCAVALAGCAETEKTGTNTNRTSSTSAQPAPASAAKTPTPRVARTASRSTATCNDFLFREAAEVANIDCPDLPELSVTGVVVPEPPGKRGRVREVIDGNTLRVTFGSDEVRVRLYIVMNPVECFGVDALVYVQRLIPVGSIAWFEEGKTKTDQYGQSLYYVWFEQGEGRYRLLQDAIIRDSYGEVVIDPPDDKYEEWLRQGQADAERLGRGLWSVCGAPHVAVAPTATNVPIVVSSSGSGGTGQGSNQQQGIGSGAGACDPSYPTVCIPPVSQVGDLDCGDISYRRFQVLRPDPHNFDRDRDGIGCES